MMKNLQHILSGSGYYWYERDKRVRIGIPIFGFLCESGVCAQELQSPSRHRIISGLNGSYPMAIRRKSMFGDAELFF